MTKPSKNLERLRPLVAIGGVCTGILIILVLSRILPIGWADVLLDYSSHRYPLSVQSAMWIAFSVGLGEILLRQLSARRELQQLHHHILPEDPRTVLQADDLGEIYKKLRENPDLNLCFLPRLIDRCILQFRSSLSIDQSASLLNTSVEMFLHELELRYNMLRYLCWLIPTLGFIGTVVGIGSALAFAGKSSPNDTSLLSTVTGLLAVSFNGTFLALVLAAILVLLQNVTQAKEEHALNLASQYCLDNLINRLYVQQPVKAGAMGRAEAMV